MGRDDGDAGSVVDKEFKVRGVEGLRVVDLSVMPELGCGHTSAMAYLIVSFLSLCPTSPLIDVGRRESWLLRTLWQSMSFK